VGLNDRINLLTRRNALCVAAGTLTALKTGLANSALAESAPPLRAVVTTASTVFFSGLPPIVNDDGVEVGAIAPTTAEVRYEYSEAAGADLGDFISEIGRFTQSCIRCDHPDLPLSVFFRPDRSSGRVEVVFELGRLFNASADDMPPYTATIFRGSQLIATIEVPVHYWSSRWRWQSAPRPLIGDADALIDEKLLPPYVWPSSNLSTVAAVPLKPYTIMGLAGITPYMPQTGERPDIGLLTESQAHYVCTRSGLALAVMNAQAEAAGTIPWHMRDENTGAPISFQQYPKASWYQDQKQGAPFIPAIKNPVNIDSAHQPALAYLPYLLTGDPYFLEELQFQATWNYGSFSLGYRPTLSQTRQFAWTVRTLGQCARITPAQVPSWLLAQPYWAALLAIHRQYFETNFVNNPSPIQSIFRATDNLAARPADGRYPAGTWCEPWQSDFLASVFGWLVTMGLTEWRTSFDWIIGGTLARTSSTSGWVRANATPYQMMLRADAKAPLAQSWAEAWLLNSSLGGLTYTTPDTWVVPDMTYLTYTRAALTYAVILGIPVGDSLSWATGQINAARWKTPFKWRIGPGLA
jgi:hypothetical protein